MKRRSGLGRGRIVMRAHTGRGGGIRLGVRLRSKIQQHVAVVTVAGALAGRHQRPLRCISRRWRGAGGVEAWEARRRRAAKGPSSRRQASSIAAACVRPMPAGSTRRAGRGRVRARPRARRSPRARPGTDVSTAQAAGPAPPAGGPRRRAAGAPRPAASGAPRRHRRPRRCTCVCSRPARAGVAGRRAPRSPAQLPGHHVGFGRSDVRSSRRRLRRRSSPRPQRVSPAGGNGCCARSDGAGQKKSPRRGGLKSNSLRRVGGDRCICCATAYQSNFCFEYWI